MTQQIDYQAIAIELRRVTPVPNALHDMPQTYLAREAIHALAAALETVGHHLAELPGGSPNPAPINSERNAHLNWHLALWQQKHGSGESERSAFWEGVRAADAFPPEAKASS